jgi:hypothetical protein
MNPSVELTLKGPADLASDMPAAFQPLVLLDNSSAGKTWLKFRFFGDRLDDLPTVRAWANALEGSTVREVVHGSHDLESSERETLRLLQPGADPRPSLEGESPVEVRECSGCWIETTWRKPDVAAQLDVIPPGRGLFSPTGTGFFVMSSDILSGLRSAGLASGLVASPLASHPDFYVISADEELGRPVCPYGSFTEPCETCGARWPRMAVYFTFEADEVPAHWCYSIADGDAVPMISTDVAQWLRGPGRALLGQDDLDEGQGQFAIGLRRRGLYPQDADIAFLPEHLHP